MNVFLAAAAVNGLIALDDFFDAQSPGLGFDLRQEFRVFVARIQAQPQLYGHIPRCPAGRDIRAGLTHRFPVLVVYEVRPTEIVVLAVVHAHAHPRTWRRHLNP